MLAFISAVGVVQCAAFEEDPAVSLLQTYAKEVVNYTDGDDLVLDASAEEFEELNEFGEVHEHYAGNCKESTEGVKKSLGSYNGRYEAWEWVGGNYPITMKQNHEQAIAAPDGQVYICKARAGGGWGVHQAKCCQCKAKNPLAATRNNMFAPKNGYRCYYDCQLATCSTCGNKEGRKKSLGAHNGPHEAFEWIGGNYIITRNQNHEQAIVAPTGQQYSCKQRAGGGWGVHQAKCCGCKAGSPEAATRNNMFAPKNGYRCYYDCTPVDCGAQCKIEEGVKKSLGAHNGPHEAFEFVGGNYIITANQNHEQAVVSPSGETFACKQRASGGWGVHQAKCCQCKARDPLSATRNNMFAPKNGYRCYYDCKRVTCGR